MRVNNDIQPHQRIMMPVTRSTLQSTTSISRFARPVLASVLAIAVLAFAPWTLAHENKDQQPDEQAKPPQRDVPTEHEMRELAGWQIRVDKRLLQEPDAELGQRALNMLEARLRAIEVVMPDKALEQLREILIQLDLDHDDLRAMQYHPSAGWLRDNGYSEDLEKVVHLPRAQALLNRQTARAMPWVILHELAHGYHDLVLGFDHPGILEHFEQVKEQRNLEEVLHASGRLQRHYALTDHKEWFAEMTEAYFGSNDFYPFVRAELYMFDREGHDLVKEVWGD